MVREGKLGRLLLLRKTGEVMIDPKLCQITIRIPEKLSGLKALVTFRLASTRIGGFMLVDGPHGLWLKPPQVLGKSIYFDEDTARFKRLQAKVIELYEQKRIQASIDEVARSNDEGINLDDIRFN